MSSLSATPPPAFAIEPDLTEALVHSMLATADTIHGAIVNAIAAEPGDAGRDSSLGVAVNRLEFLTAQLRALVAGVPGTLVPTVDPAGRHGDSMVEDGTQIELYNSFDRTWTAGFEIASAAEVGYRVRRHSDGSLLPGFTSRCDFRAIAAHERT